MTVIDDYLTRLDAPQKAALNRIRKIAKEVVPEVEDTIGYGMPVLRYKNRYLIGFCNFKDHLSLFPGSQAPAIFKDRLAGFKQGKGTIQFTLDHEIPEELLKEIIQSCREKIDEK